MGEELPEYLRNHRSTMAFDGDGASATATSADNLARARWEIAHPDAKPNRHAPPVKGRTCGCGMDRSTFPDRESFETHRQVNGC